MQSKESLGVHWILGGMHAKKGFIRLSAFKAFSGQTDGHCGLQRCYIQSKGMSYASLDRGKL